jgi:glycosyltransferase involved in cell wall biosynthesis
MTGKVFIFCGGPTIYGKEIVGLLLARGLRDTGWCPEFITSRWNNPDVTRWLKNTEFKVTFLWLGFISLTFRREPLRCTCGQLARWPQLLIGFVRIANKNGIRAIVHTNWHHCLLLLPLLNPRRDIYWLHEIPRPSRRYGFVFRAIARRVGRIVCVSQAVAERMLSLRVPAEKVVVVRNGIPFAERSGAGGEREHLRLGIVGQIGVWKGHEDLFDALGLLQREGIRPSLLIFGSDAPEYKATLRRCAAQLDIEDQIEWRGYVAEKSRIYSAIDVCVVPSRFDEPLSTSAIEAGGFGCPVICSSRGGLPEIVEHGKTGFVVEPECPQQLAEAIKAFARKRHLVKTMGAAAQIRARTEFSTQRFVNEFVQVLDGLKAVERK